MHMFLVIMLLILVSVLILCFVDLAVLLRLPRLELTVEAEHIGNKYNEYIAIKNTGGCILNEASVEIGISMYVRNNEETEMLNISESILIHDLAPNGKKMIQMLTSDRLEHAVFENSLICTGGSWKKIEWIKDSYLGYVKCSYEKRTVERKIAVERTEYSVRTYIFRF